MAQMIPNTLNSLSHSTSTVTPGEIRVFNYLSNLDRNYYVWFDLGIANTEVYPDFILIVPNRGLLVLEVKDWSLDKIQSFNKERVNLKYRSAKNPILRSREYITLILKQLNKSEYLKDKNGNFIFEWQYGVVFPNIDRNEFMNFNINKIKLESVITEEKVLFSNDLADTSKKTVKKNIDSFFKRKTAKMTFAQFYEVKRIICPETQIKDKKIAMKHNNGEVHLQAVLDNPQEMVAKSIGEGRRLLHGIAGSGKTLIMLFRAKLITKLHPKWKVLFLCWNIALRSYLSKMFDSINIEGNFENVEIINFTQFLREKYNHFMPKKNFPKLMDLSEKETDTVLSQLIKDFLEKVSLNKKDKYQAIFIDEAQDFKGEYFLLLNEFMDKKTNSMLVCADEAQNIMKRQWNLSEFKVVNINDYINLEDNYALRKNYRNTVEILKFAANIFNKNLPVRTSDNRVYNENKIYSSNIHDLKPIINSFKDWEDQYHTVANWIIDLTKENNDISFGDILVIFPGEKLKKYQLIERIFNWYNIPFYSLAKDINGKANLDVTNDEVKVSTIASSKGMDFKAVALVNAEEALNKYEDMKSVLYTAVTRAREKLYIAVDEHSKVYKFLLSVYEKAFSTK